MLRSSHNQQLGPVSQAGRLGTYSLAAHIVLPRSDPEAVAIKGPTAATEEEYVHSVNQSTDA